MWRAGEACVRLNQLKTMRKEAGLTQAQVANKLGVTCGTLSRWENGKGEPTLVQFRSLCQIYGLRCAPPPDRSGERRSSEFPDIALDPSQGEIYRNADAVVARTDALMGLRALPDACVDLVFADPPYNIGKQFGDFKDQWASDEEYVKWCQRWLAQCLRVMRPAGSLYLMASTQAMPLLDAWLRERIFIRSRIVWHYDSSGVQAKKHFGSVWEPILYCVKDPNEYTFNSEEILVEARTGAVRKLIDYRKNPPAPYNSKKVPGNLWYFPRVRYQMQEYEQHPSQKPEALLRRIIKASSSSGDLILDPFSGTFTSGAVAKCLDRKFIGFEQQEEYLQIGLRRLGISVPRQ